ncbi:hypothetical protein QJQ45_028037 [Haematococcus lacustris]|nr:hypothetical protein QJQ45_028037 [Haematococcus lacustris]
MARLPRVGAGSRDNSLGEAPQYSAAALAHHRQQQRQQHQQHREQQQQQQQQQRQQQEEEEEYDADAGLESGSLVEEEEEEGRGGVFQEGLGLGSGEAQEGGEGLGESGEPEGGTPLQQHAPPHHHHHHTHPRQAYPRLRATVPRLAPPGQAIGIITIEDVIEELIRTEIIDETDRFIDNERRVAVEQAVLVASLPERLRAAVTGKADSHGSTAARLLRMRAAQPLGGSTASLAQLQEPLLSQV